MSGVKHLTNSLSEVRVYLSDKAYRKILEWVDLAAPLEVSGLGTVEIRNGHYYVKDAFLVKQENSSSDTEMDAQALSVAHYEHHQSGSEDYLNFWWHSHANMGVFWSGTDHEAMRNFGAGGWVLATVFNTKREMRSALYQSGDKKTGRPEFFQDNIKTVWYFEGDSDFKAAMKKEYDENVMKPKYTYQRYAGGNQKAITEYYSRDSSKPWKSETRSYGSSVKDYRHGVTNQIKPPYKAMKKILQRQKGEKELEYLTRCHRTFSHWFRSDFYPDCLVEMIKPSAMKEQGIKNHQQWVNAVVDTFKEDWEFIYEGKDRPTSNH